jgi:hypothetical protein
MVGLLSCRCMTPVVRSDTRAGFGPARIPYKPLPTVASAAPTSGGKHGYAAGSCSQKMTMIP